MGILQFKAGVTLRNPPEPVTARLLGVLDHMARMQVADLVVTSGSDSHPVTDPHTLGRAFDIRTHGLPDDSKHDLLFGILDDLQDGPDEDPQPMTIEGIWLAAATRLWFAQIEHHNEPDEHLHVQLRNGRVFP